MSDKIRILYIDDYQLDRELVKDVLEKEHGGFEVTEASNKQEFEALLKNSEFDVVLSDFNIAGFEGLQVIDFVHAHDLGIPVIIVTGTGSEEIAVKALKQGAADYVIKRPRHIQKLPQTIFAVIENKLLRDQRQKDRSALMESGKKYRMLFENMAQGVFYQSADGIVIDCNQSALDMIGLTRNQFIGKTSVDTQWKIIHEDGSEFPREQQPSMVALRTGKPVRNVIAGVFNPRLESYVWLSINAIPEYKTGEDKPCRMFVTLHDITERKLAENELRESEDKFKHIFEYSSVGKSITFTSGEMEVNKAFYTMLGYSQDEFRDLRWQEIAYPDDVELSQKVIDSLLSGKNNSERFTKRYLHKNGSVIWADVSTTLRRDREGKPLYFMSTISDITDRKKMEEEILKSRKLESLGVLAGGIAHDFNNILTAIIGNIAMARMQTKPDDERFELLSEAEAASARAQTLTGQLLTFSKGGAPLKEIASIKDILKESCSFVLRGSKADCEYSIAKDLWPAEVDTGQISQVINNIMINANQAMPEGGMIQIAAENLLIDDSYGLPLTPGEYIRISIKDQGVGISEKHFLNIFDPYFTTKQQGSGLGLATTYSIIKKHDGHITLESQIGIGTTFYIYLPASEETVSEKEEIQLVTGHGRILVMDDEAPLRKMVGRMLKSLCYESEFAKNGSEAIKMYKEAKEAGKPYDAVILDLTIPGGMGGKEAIKKLLEIDPEIKAIVSSGYSNDPVLANFLEYGFKGIMPKPFETLYLSNVLNEVLKGGK
ncbi:MAG: PAS domain S-box protein [Proteobacteria bacterium]|nr:PAS domain S-box protein [Pseudomonadota bacterium]